MAQVQIQIPRISKSETAKYAGIWTYNGVAVTLDDASLVFATDFCNIILKQFTMMMAQASMQAQNPAPEKKLVTE
jgi:hypothetical protein